MSRLPKNVLELPLERRVMLALRSGVRKAIAERRRLGLPVYILSHGKVVDIAKSRPRKGPRHASARKTR
jgi:hypothetical protein